MSANPFKPYNNNDEITQNQQLEPTKMRDVTVLKQPQVAEKWPAQGSKSTRREQRSQKESNGREGQTSDAADPTGARENLSRPHLVITSRETTRRAFLP